MSEETISVQLVSAVGVDYSNLQQLLAAGKWREADEETARMMCKVAKREKQGWLDEEDIKKFPCKDLRTLDQLWVKYSNGRFGFSVQKCIWESVGGKPGEWDYGIYKLFGAHVGWYAKIEHDWKYEEDITFSLDAPVGHLPFFIGCMGVLWAWPSSLASRVVKCNL